MLTDLWALIMDGVISESISKELQNLSQILACVYGLYFLYESVVWTSSSLVKGVLIRPSGK